MNTINYKRIITDGVICLLVVLNICVVAMVCQSVKPKCIIDECNHPRVAHSFYCTGHTYTPNIEVKIYYGKR